MNYYVSADGPMLGDGSQDAPFRRIGQAAEAARPGDTVIVAPGIYRECVNPKNGGTSDGTGLYTVPRYRGQRSSPAQRR